MCCKQEWISSCAGDSQHFVFGSRNRDFFPFGKSITCLEKITNSDFLDRFLSSIIHRNQCSLSYTARRVSFPYFLSSWPSVNGLRVLRCCESCLGDAQRLAANCNQRKISRTFHMTSLRSPYVRKYTYLLTDSSSVSRCVWLSGQIIHFICKQSIWGYW